MRILIVLVLSATLTSCGLLGIRRSVGAGQAREILAEAVRRVAADETSSLCELSPAEAATTCPDTLVNAGGVVPVSPPEVVCAFGIPDDGPLRKGVVLVVEGVDSIDDPYRTEFIVFDDGDAIGVLDAVYWSGLSVQSYDDDTVTWQFDSASESCSSRSLPGGSVDAPGAPAVPEATPGR